MENDKIVSLVAQTAVKIASSKEKSAKETKQVQIISKVVWSYGYKNWVKGEFKEKVLIE